MASPLSFIEAPAGKTAQSFSEAILEGLTQTPKTLPCRFFYDDAGSALFEQICDLPEYYPTRTERGILESHAEHILQAALGRETGAASPGPETLTIIELGSGSSYKTRLLLQAALRARQRLHYVPIDISGEFLRQCAAALLTEYAASGLSLTAVAAEYRDALALLPPREGPRLFLFLGSNIGNFSTEAASDLLMDIRSQMFPSDRLLLGVDLVKETRILEAAYDDAAGVTAAFNLNLLTRINREMNSDFDLSLWEHQARFNLEASRIEMWLISRANQFVTFPREGHHAAFEKGEGIHTENSHKYTPETLSMLCDAAGLTIQATWTDPQNWFASFLLCPKNDGVL